MLLINSTTGFSEDKYSQEVNEVFDLSLSELMSTTVVVASLFEEDERDVASTVNAVSKLDWKKRGAKTVSEAISHLPSTQILDTFSASQMPVFRGLTSITAVRGTLTLFEGVPLNSFALGTAAYDIDNIELGTLDRIEVIRGPGSALYGADAFQGVISYRAFNEEKVTSTLDVAAGSDRYYQSQYQYSNGFSQPLEIDLTVSSSGQGRQSHAFNYTDSATNSPNVSKYEHFFETHTLYLKAATLFKNEASIEANVLFNEHKPDGFPGLAPLCQSNILPATNSVEDCFHSAEKQLLLGKVLYQQPFSNKMVLDLSAYHWKTESIRDLPRVSAGTLLRKVQALDEQRSGIKALLKQKRSDNIWIQQWALGAEFAQQKIEHFTDKINGQLSVPASIPQLQEGDARNLPSFFFQAESAIIPQKLKTIYGVRLDKYQSFGNQTTPRAGLIYEADAKNTVKILWGNAFRAPTGFELEGTAAIIGDKDIEPEEVETYELSWISTRDNSKQVITLFNNVIENTIQLSPSPSGSGKSLAYVNTSDNNKAYGLEYEYNIIYDTWSIEFNASYTESKNAGSGADFVAFPRRIFNINVGKDLPKYGTSLFLTSKIHDGMTESPTSSKSLRTFWQTDLHISKSLTNNSELYMDIANIFDRENYLPSVWLVENGIPQESINLTLGFSINF